MKILAIDTSSSEGSAALSTVDGSVFVQSGNQGEQYATRLFSWLEHLKKVSGFKNGFRELDAVAVICGPGTFTGLRVGVAAAKGIAMSAGCPLVPLPTLETMVIAAGQGPSLRRPVLNAGRGQVYTAVFRMDDDHSLEVLENESARDPASIRLSGESTLLVFGNGVERLKEDLLRWPPENVYFRKEHPMLAPAMIPMTARELASGKRFLPKDIQIRYIRPAVS
jgi:tRNA threonylcarbamoyladenosine biosynthesis protein TsaB